MPPAEPKIEVQPLLPASINYSKMVTVIAGQGSLKKSFIIHEDVINNSSPYFKSQSTAAKGCEDGANRIVDLPKIPAHIFEIYADWSYTATAKIALGKDGTRTYVANHGDHCRRHCVHSARTHTYLQLWAAATSLLDARFEKHILEELKSLMRHWTRGLSAESIHYAWHNAERSCAMQRFILSSINFRTSYATLADPLLKSAEIAAFWQDLAMYQLHAAIPRS
ncbi:unnamed protein product [Zymoseptoria tritici ST99CH_3D1]|nr:unnamed protein product [Zymoseptoria tritici ST99CH_3D1]